MTPEEIQPKSRATRYFLFGLAFVLALSLLVVLRWAYQTSNVLTVKNAPVPVRTIRSEAHPAGVVILKVDYCKNVAASGTVRASFVGKDREIFLPEAKDKQDPICQVVEVPVIVPEDITPGEYYVHFRVRYHVNPLKHEVVEDFDSKKFKVVD